MGQCSTLPAESRPTSSLASSIMRRNAGDTHHGGSGIDGSGSYRQNGSEEQRKRLNESGRRESLDFNSLLNDDAVQKETEEKPTTPHLGEKRGNSHLLHPTNGGLRHKESDQPQTRDPEFVQVEDVEPEPMDVDDSREDAPPTSFPPPPEGAVRTRCYRLNLDSELCGISNASQKAPLSFGPFTEPPPMLTYSSSDDSSQPNATKVAIQTAQIFRGITISRDGTILSQNARATRSNRGSKTKRGEKSRQAAKIDKANDLVEEAVAAGNNDPEERVNMVSLVIIGEYDDMKYLIRDGSKRLREADGLSDDKLVAVNRPRSPPKPPKPEPSSNTAAALISPRKRSSVSPNVVNASQRTVGSQTTGSPEKKQTSHTSPKSAPPKLKSHPRDTRPGRREERTNTRMRLDSCHDFMDPRRAEVVGDGDWSHAWNIWNCGGTGTVSPPNQPSSPHDGSKAVFEGRESNYSTRSARENGVTGRAN